MCDALRPPGRGGLTLPSGRYSKPRVSSKVPEAAPDRPAFSRKFHETVSRRRDHSPRRRRRMRRAGLVQLLQAGDDRAVFRAFPGADRHRLDDRGQAAALDAGHRRGRHGSAAKGVDVAGQVGGVVKADQFQGERQGQGRQVLVQIDDSVERAGLAGRQVDASPSARTRSTGTRQLFNSNVATTADAAGGAEQARPGQGRAGRRSRRRSRRRRSRRRLPARSAFPKIDPGQYRPAGTVIATLQDLSQDEGQFHRSRAAAAAAVKLGQAVEPRPQRGSSRLQRRDHRHRPEDRSDLAPRLGPGAGRQCRRHAAPRPVRPRARPPAGGAQRDRAAADRGR